MFNRNHENLRLPSKPLLSYSAKGRDILRRKLFSLVKEFIRVVSHDSARSLETAIHIMRKLIRYEKDALMH